MRDTRESWIKCPTKIGQSCSCKIYWNFFQAADVAAASTDSSNHLPYVLVPPACFIFCPTKDLLVDLSSLILSWEKETWRLGCPDLTSIASSCKSPCSPGATSAAAPVTLQLRNALSMVHWEEKHLEKLRISRYLLRPVLVMLFQLFELMWLLLLGIIFAYFVVWYDHLSAKSGS